MSDDDSDQQRRFTLMYEAYYDPVANYVKRRAPEADVESVLHEVFTTAWRKLLQIPQDLPLPWLFDTARKTLANGFRSNNHRQHGERIVGGSAPRQQGDHADAVVHRLSLNEALGQLSERDRIILELIAFDGLTVAEAAKQLGLKRTTVLMRVHRLRNHWQQTDGTRPDHVGVHPLVRVLGRNPHAR